MEVWTILRWWYICCAVLFCCCLPVNSNVARTSERLGGNRHRGSLKLDRPSAVAQNENDDGCEELETEQLAQMLGGAYNTRYMSITAPEHRLSSSHSKKRGADGDLLFAVDDGYSQELSDTPAWEMNFASYDTEVDEETFARNRRSVAEDGEAAEEEDEVEEAAREQRSAGGGPATDVEESKRLWDCGMVIKWKDLGQDYFPRHIRTVECTKTKCFYGQFRCQPRSFTIQLLRRKGRCVRARSQRNSTTTQHKTGVEGLPYELRELWVWEERALNFCCECSAPVRAQGHRYYF